MSGLPDNQKTDHGATPPAAMPSALRVVLPAVAVLLIVVALVILVGTNRSREAVSAVRPTRDLNVLLITLDTTRADALGCYGHPTIHTPNIDALARGGVRFTQCTTAAPITLPAHTTIMTSTYPFVHRARMNGAFVADSNLTLAEVLAGAGYATGAEVGAYVLDAVWGLDQGFDSYRSDSRDRRDKDHLDLPVGEQSVPAEDVCNRAIQWLNRHGAAERFFLWVHFFDPHQPWRPPRRFAEVYGKERFGAYLGEIAYVDEQIGRLLDACRRLDLEDDTLIVVTADHGEGLMQHDELTHTYYVYDSTLHVPLIIYCADVVPAGRVVTTQTRTVDIAPTILAVLGMNAPKPFEGVSLVSLIDDPQRDMHLAAYAESINAYTSFGYARLRTVRSDGWKYIHAPEPELYDVQRDGGETDNLASSEVARLAAMKELLENVVETAAPVNADDTERTSALDAEAAERLAALGYIGGYAPADIGAGEADLLRSFAGPDPKQHIDAYNRFLKATGWIDSGQPTNAEPILLDLIAAEPANPGFREAYADMLRKVDRPQDAIQQYLALLELRPEHAIAHYRVGRLYGQVGELDAGVAHLTRAAEAMPKYPGAHAYLALALLRQGNSEAADREFRTALELDPAMEEPHLGLSGLLYSAGRHAQAIDVLREGLRLRPDAPQLANNLAWYLATVPEPDLRNPDEALHLARSLVDRLGDDNPGVLDTLAAALAATGRFDDAAKVARTASDRAAAAGAKELADEIRRRLARYQAGQPYIDAQTARQHP